MGLPVLRPQTTKTTALDAALLAGFQAGVLSEPAQLKKRLAIERVFEPHRSRDETQAHLQAWDLAVEGSR